MKRSIILFLILFQSFFAYSQFNLDSLYGKSKLDYELDLEHQVKRNLDSSLILNNSEDFVVRGFRNLKRGNHVQAIHDFQKTIQKNEIESSKYSTFNDPFPYYYIGVAYNMLFMEDSAKYYFNKVLDIDPLFRSVHTELGLIALKNEKYELAIEHFKKSEKDYTKSIMALNNIAYSYFLAKENKLAKKYYRKVIDINPAYNNTYLKLAIIKLEENRSDSAIFFLNRAVDETPYSPVVYYMRGLYYYQKEKWINAYNDFQKITELDSTDVEGEYLMNVINIKLGKYNKGIKGIYQVLNKVFNEYNYGRVQGYSMSEYHCLLEEYVKGDLMGYEKKLFNKYHKFLFDKNYFRLENTINNYYVFHPNSIFGMRLRIYFYYNFWDDYFNADNIDKLLEKNDTLYTLNFLKGRLLLEKGLDNESIPYFQRAVKSFPEYAQAYYLMGYAYLSLKFNNDAYSCFNKAIELYDDNSNYFLSRGEIHEKQKEINRAMKDYRKALEINPSSTRSLINIGRCYSELKMEDSAIFNFTRVINLDTSNYRAYNYRALSLIEKEKHVYALEDFRKAIQINPDYTDALMNRGEFFRELEHYNKAIKDFDRVIGINPKYDYAYYQMAFCQSKLGNYNQAIKNYKKYIDMKPESGNAYGNLGWAYYKKGRFKKCIKYSKIAIEKDDKAYFAMFNLALSKLRLGEIKEAKILYEKYASKCKSENKEINEGVIKDLEDLIEQGILVAEAEDIINNILNRN